MRVTLPFNKQKTFRKITSHSDVISFILKSKKSFRFLTPFPITRKSQPRRLTIQKQINNSAIDSQFRL